MLATVNRREYQDRGNGILFAIRVVLNDEGELFQCFRDYLCIRMEIRLAIVGTKAEDDKIQGAMAVQQDGKLFGAIPVLFKRIIKDGGPTSEPFLYDAIFGSQYIGKQACPPLFERPPATTGIRTEKIGVSKAKYMFHHLSSLSIGMNCNEGLCLGQTTFLGAEIGRILFSQDLLINLVAGEVFINACKSAFTVFLP